VAVHGAVLLGDRYVRPGLAQLVLPFGFPYRPAWVGLGQVAAYAAAAVYASFYVRRRTGYRFWWNLHYGAGASPGARGSPRGMGGGAERTGSRQ
jgi:sulfoxide reductase heme-binding subunit YedZ